MDGACQSAPNESETEWQGNWMKTTHQQGD